MSKILAIKGHPTRGNEVIELMQMMGGSNFYKHIGNNDETFYYIDGRNNIDCDWTLWNNNLYTIFTLEKFLWKYPFKIDDRVIDKADGCTGVISEMKWDADVSDMKYCVVFGNGIDFGWFTNDSIEFCKDNKNLEETQSKRDLDKSEFVIKNMILPNKVDDKLEYEIIDGYEFDKVENNRIILKPVKPKYPATYGECKAVLQLQDSMVQARCGYEWRLISYFQQLLMCRDAYWKIAGEELGLGGRWEPDWDDHNQPKFGIHNVQNNIHPIDIHVLKNFVLVFPTEEMRDVFYKNFNYLIEACKELL